jgi:N-methylhydantoinase A/oxoprolinase/acetone carboxylase beta subunit
VLNIPLVKIDSIGAGTGSFVHVNPNSNRPELGPDSAGSRIGVCWPEGGLDTISVTDLNVVLGRVNPDFFLGGQVQLDPERARFEVERQLAEPIGLSVDDAPACVLELFEETRSPELGYLVTQAIVTGAVDVEKPALPALDSVGSAQPKASRAVHWGNGFVDTDVYDLESITAGQEVEGPAVLESQATTFAIPPGRRATLDRNQVFHLT